MPPENVIMITDFGNRIRSLRRFAEKRFDVHKVNAEMLRLMQET